VPELAGGYENAVLPDIIRVAVCVATPNSTLLPFARHLF